MGGDVPTYCAVYMSADKWRTTVYVRASAASPLCMQLIAQIANVCIHVGSACKTIHLQLTGQAPHTQYVV